MEKVSECISEDSKSSEKSTCVRIGYLLPGEHARAQMLLRPRGGGRGELDGGGGSVCQSGLPSIARFLAPHLRRGNSTHLAGQDGVGQKRGTEGGRRGTEGGSRVTEVRSRGTEGGNRGT
jgi:hypothetical protein